MKVNCRSLLGRLFACRSLIKNCGKLRTSAVSPASVPKRRDAERTAELEDRIRAQLEGTAVIVAHYYMPEIQALAEATGGCVSDSLEMARFGRDHPAIRLLSRVCDSWARRQRS